MKIARKGVVVFLAAGVVAGVLAGILLVREGACAMAASPAEQKQAHARLMAIHKEKGALAEAFPAVAEYVMPSVVSISTTQKVRQRVSPFGLPDRFRFGPQAPNVPRGPEREYERHGLGSGFVVDPRGYIVTNNHVVRDVDAADVTVTFPDGSEVVASEVHRDANTDLAVIKVEGKDLPALKWADVDSLRIGEWVIAIGSPLGFGNTVTAGIISATTTQKRVFRGGKRSGLRISGSPFAIEDYIQTDAAINPGNSGGPLVNLKGEVIGVNTLIVSRTGNSAGLGFAVPAKRAAEVVASLIDKGKVDRGYLGIEPIDLRDIDDAVAWKRFRVRNADDLRDEFRIKEGDRGVLVAQVLEGSPAAEGGLEQGDIIIEFGGRKTEDGRAFRLLVAASKPGAEVEAKVMRKGREQKLKIKLGSQPTERPTVAVRGKSVRSDELGIEVQQLTPDIAKALGYGADVKGVIVTNVAPGGPASKAGAQRNDVIVQVNREAVTNGAAFAKAIGKVGKKDMVLLVRRGDDTEFITIPARR